MIRAVVRDWSAWAPGLESREAWQEWAASPAPLRDDGAPDARAVPAMIRRRCTTLSRAMLTAAYGATSGIAASSVRTVFASRYGSINESVPLLRNIAYDEKMSPSRFTHTVHNAQSGLFSIAVGNRHASSALSARAESFACGFLEAATHLHREPERPVLLVMGDVTLAEAFASLIDDPPAVYSVALVLASSGEGTAVRFGVRGDEQPAKPGTAVAADEALRRGWSDAAEFVRWMLSEEAGLVLKGNGREWWWQRDADTASASR
ncbi:MAG TPA: beta-ketoacyl synthase chain length factor [Candidatus Limnocylindrales bacterium]|nr:beta-ketoacyl synthase chain length factor [Candidatus Limnocylindrales bacterium]